jgi:hypothetical protein
VGERLPVTLIEENLAKPLTLAGVTDRAMAAITILTTVNPIQP